MLAGRPRPPGDDDVGDEKRDGDRHQDEGGEHVVTLMQSSPRG